MNSPITPIPPIPIANRKTGSTFLQTGSDTLLRAALRAGQGLAYECNAGGCGACKFELLEGEVEELWPTAPGLSPRDRQRGRRLACQCRARGPLVIAASQSQEYVPQIPPARREAKLVARVPITHDIWEFQFHAPGPADFLPGQYALMDLPGVAGSRAYSLANIANADGAWHFQIRRIPGGAATAVLFDQLAVGDTLSLDGPYGIATLRTASPRPLVCIAGGSGLAPMLAIARGAAAAGLLRDRPLYFFYGGRTPADLCGREQLAALAAPPGAIHYLPVVSAPPPGQPWTGAQGYVHEHLAAQLPGPLADYEFYFAGPPPMSQALQELLMVTHQVPYGQIHFDRFF